MFRPHSALLMLLSIAAATGGLAIGGVVRAQDTAEAGPTLSIEVRFDDLDLRHPAGARVLLHRIETAAIEVCGGQPDRRDPVQAAAFDRCRVAATDQAVSLLDETTLTAMADLQGLPLRLANR